METATPTQRKMWRVQENHERSLNQIMQSYPRITAHIICASLGYATPSCAAGILKTLIEGKKNYCEWIYCCHAGNPKPAVERAIRGRHSHHGFMSDYTLAKALVDENIKSGNEPIFASWF